MVLAHLGHRLVQMCLRLLREEIWKLHDTKKLHRVAVRVVPDTLAAQPVVLLWSRLVITGGDHRRLHEELTLSGGELGHDRFSRITQVAKREELLAAATPVEPTDALFAVLKERFANSKQSIMSAVEARSKERLDSLDKTLNDRLTHDLTDLHSVLDELEQAITRELNPDDAESALYLPGLSPQEMSQVSKDIAALESRLARIPAERAAEEAAIKPGFTDGRAGNEPLR